MKKLLIVLCAIILLAGCGNKTNEPATDNKKQEEVVKPDEKSVIDCSLEQESTKVSFVFNYNDTKGFVEDGQMLMDLRFDSLTDAQFNSVKTQNFCELTIKDLNADVEIYSNCKQTDEGKTVHLTFDIDLDKLSEFENGLFKSSMTKAQVIKYLENQNAVCKK